MKTYNPYIGALISSNGNLYRLIQRKITDKHPWCCQQCSLDGKCKNLIRRYHRYCGRDIVHSYNYFYKKII